MAYHIFNASHDEALAFGGDNFTPSKAACFIDRDLAALPYWYADEGDCVVTDRADEVRTFLDRLPVRRNVAIAYGIEGATTTCIEPWGWDKVLVAQLMRLGVPRHAMPDDKFLALVRRLQHRETVSHYLPVLFGEISSNNFACKHAFTGSSRFVRSIAELHTTMAFKSGQFILKRPWSGSGRGLCISRRDNSSRTDNWLLAAIREQGGAEVQPFYDNVCNCAAEFLINHDYSVTFTGYSMFHTDQNGTYTENIISNDIETAICTQLGAAREALHAAHEALRRTLPIALPKYHGAVGVDMMVCRDKRDSKQLRLFPCVEINVRRTMGMVATALIPLISKGSTGQYIVMHERTSNILRQKHDALRHTCPITTDNGHIAEGYLPLTPIFADTHFHACLIVKRNGIIQDRTIIQL